MTIKHKHHIIPKHMGGTDDSTNLVELTIEEHAEAHRALYEQYGKWQDEIAWKALSGQISKADINHYISVINNLGEKNPMYGKPGPMKGKKHTEETKLKIKKARSKQIIKHSEETKNKIGNYHRGKIISQETKEKIIQSNKNRFGEKRNTYKNKGIKQPELICPHCNQKGGTGAMIRWHFNNCKIKANI